MPGRRDRLPMIVADMPRWRAIGGKENGVPGGDRTRDPLIKSQMLYR